MEDIENLKFWKLTDKRTGTAITVITDAQNETKLLEAAKDTYDIEQIPPDPELLKNARPITEPVPFHRMETPPVEIMEPFEPYVRDTRHQEMRQRKQQNKWAARQNRKK